MQYDSKIAVVGMAGLFPGAPDLRAYWQNIVSKFAAVRNAPGYRWKTDRDAMVSPIPMPDKALNNRCCLVEKIDIDPTKLNLPPDLIADLDPLHRMVLHVGQKAVSDPSKIVLNGQRTGVILAAIALPTDASSSLTGHLLQAFFEKKLFGTSSFRLPEKNMRMAAGVTAAPAALLARALNLGGGTYTLDAACASSIYAVKLACDELIAGRSDTMLAGGVSRPDCLYTQVGFSQLRALSPSGLCAPFDHRADGLVVGEGAGILVLKRMADAIADNDHIYGVIHGIGLSNDMRGNLLAPESNGQVRAMRAAYSAAGWRPTDIDLIECHGAGTPVGDTTELNSLCTLWGDTGWTPGQCAIGSVKSMIGHLLTAAGAAGIIKTVLALKENTLPPSLNFDHPPENSPLPHSPFRVQTDAAHWPRRQNHLRRAAVSAFGFGGINGHLLLEEWADDHNPKLNPPLSTTDTSTGKDRTVVSIMRSTPPVIAVVGMAVSFGSNVSLPEFQDLIFNGRSTIGDRPKGRWKGLSALFNFPAVDLPQRGGFMSSLRVGVKEFRIPPKEVPDILPQHLLMLQVAADAMRDAGLSDKADRPGMGAVIGLDFDFEATNYHFRWALPALVRKWHQQHFPDMDKEAIDAWMSTLQDSVTPPLTASRTLGALGGIIASRIAREFRFGSASFGVSAEAASGNRALEIGIRSLQRNESDAMLVGAVDLAGDIRKILTSRENGSSSAKGTLDLFGSDASGTLPGEGAAALILKRYKQAVADGDRIYALVSGMGHSCGQPDNPDDLSDTFIQALKLALNEANVSSTDIDHVETNVQGIWHRDHPIGQALSAEFSSRKNPCSIGSCGANLGHTGAASGLAAIVKTALSLYNEIIPPLVGYRSADDDKSPGKHFKFPNFPYYWFRNRHDGPRRAGIGILSGDGNVAAAILQEVPERSFQSKAIQSVVREERRHPLGPAPLALFVVQGNSRKTLLSGVRQLYRYAGQSKMCDMPVDTAASGWLERHPFDSTSPLAAVFLAPDMAALTAFTHEARQAIEKNRSQDFGPGGGFCYRTAPLGSGELAFVYPGSGNHYPGMGREIALHWPEILRRLDEDSRHLKSQFRPDEFALIGTGIETDRTNDDREKLVTDPLSPIIGPVAFGCMTTTLLHGLNVNPQAIIGYSLGEVTGLVATQAWPDRDKVLERMLDTNLFHEQLSGPYLAARKAWGLRSEEKFTWRASVVNRSAEAVRTALEDIPAARLLIINTEEECVVGGDVRQIDTLIRRLGCQSIDLDGVITVHCDAMSPVAAEYRALHVFQTVAPQGIRFYSCSSGRAYTPTTDSAADSILSQALHGFDFPRTIDQAYADGVRVFLELGPGASCSRMIRRILGDNPHLALSLDMPGTDGVGTILKGIGTLIAHRIPLNIEWLYPVKGDSRLSPSAGRRNNSDVIEIPVGGQPLSPARPMHSKTVQPTTAICSPLSSTAPESHLTAGPSMLADKQAGDGRERPKLSVPQQPAPSDTRVNNRIDERPPLSAERELKSPTGQSNLINELTRTLSATAAAHKKYLDFSTDLSRSFDEALTYHSRLVETLSRSGTAKFDDHLTSAGPSQITDESVPVAYDRAQCLEFATGRVANVLGPKFAPVDTYRTRVRLPAEPLMLVDRILSVKGVKGSMTSGRLVTEHDIHDGAWYLDGDRAPVCIAVEAGQADLFLCSYLGIDLTVRGKRVYRLLDASVVFHRHLPRPGETIRYEIKIDKFIRQGQTILFFFNFEGSIDNQPLISMTDGCAGFFTEEEIQNSGGIILTAEDREELPGQRDPQWTELVPQALESYTDNELNALRMGNLAACFGATFDGVVLSPALRLPGGRMKLIDRIQQLDPQGGRYRLGAIRAEADIHPDDWFLTCHFVDDMTMPGTLMYECCSHTLRVFLLRLGWVTDRPGIRYDTVPGIKSVLQCRGPVTPRTRQVVYEVEIKEIGYGPEPYALADAHMYADDRYIVRFTDMAIRMSGLNRETLINDWQSRRRFLPRRQEKPSTPVFFDRGRILAFAIGKPSEAFGDRYEAFDTDRFLARLPAPPYSFIDRVIKAEPEPWKLKPGGWVEAEFDVRPDDWYFIANQSDHMPYCVLLEIALQACGWLAAYAGSALRSANDLRFRNLDGQAILHREVSAAKQTLRSRCRMTKVSIVGDIIIESFEFQVLDQDHFIYDGKTVFGFFTSDALADQRGVQVDEHQIVVDGSETRDAAHGIHLPDRGPLTPADADGPLSPCGLAMPAKALRMIDRIEIRQPLGGPHGLGYLRATKKIDPAEWFFDAHFYQDPVCPGSLGIESFLQLLKFEAIRRWGHLTDDHRFEHTLSGPHTWKYRGQISKQNQIVEVEAFIKYIKNEPEPELRADGILTVDGLPIYHMKDYGIRLVPL